MGWLEFGPNRVGDWIAKVEQKGLDKATLGGLSLFNAHSRTCPRPPSGLSPLSFFDFPYVAGI